MKGRRVVGIAVASGRVAYVFLIDDKLYSWGLSRKAAESPEEARRIIQLWVARMRPDVLVVEKITERCRKGEKAKAIVKAIADVAADAPLNVVSVPRRRSHRNKYVEALALADRFSQLQDRLPKKRKVWDSEPRNTTIFEALSLVLTVVDDAKS
jgi:hypothetical protein